MALLVAVAVPLRPHVGCSTATGVCVGEGLEVGLNRSLGGGDVEDNVPEFPEDV